VTWPRSWKRLPPFGRPEHRFHGDRAIPHRWPCSSIRSAAVSAIRTGHDLRKGRGCAATSGRHSQDSSEGIVRPRYHHRRPAGSPDEVPGRRGCAGRQGGRAARRLAAFGGRCCRAADRRLAQALGGQGFTLLIDQSSSCGKGLADYPNGRLPASALCPLYAAPGESLTRDARPGRAWHWPRSRRRPELRQPRASVNAAQCPALRVFHPAWAEPSGVLPEPWHWEFAG